MKFQSLSFKYKGGENEKEGLAVRAIRHLLNEEGKMFLISYDIFCLTFFLQNGSNDNIYFLLTRILPKYLVASALLGRKRIFFILRLL